MKQSIGHVALVVRDYDEAIEFFTQKLRFRLIEDTAEEGKRWVLVAPPGSAATNLLLAQASTPEQESALATKPVDGCFSSCTRTTSPGTTRI